MKKFLIDMLNENTVSIVTVFLATIDGEEIEVKRTRKAYNNSSIDRQLLIDELGKPYTTAIFAIWGDTPTVTDPPTPTELESEE